MSETPEINVNRLRMFAICDNGEQWELALPDEMETRIFEMLEQEEEIEILETTINPIGEN